MAAEAGKSMFLTDRLLDEANEKSMNKIASSLEKKDTFPKLLLHHAKASGNAPAYRQKNLGIWQTCLLYTSDAADE